MQNRDGGVSVEKKKTQMHPYANIVQISQQI